MAPRTGSSTTPASAPTNSCTPTVQQSAALAQYEGHIDRTEYTGVDDGIELPMAGWGADLCGAGESLDQARGDVRRAHHAPVHKPAPESTGTHMPVSLRVCNDRALID
jgi:hypothetical protein